MTKKKKLDEAMRTRDDAIASAYSLYKLQLLTVRQFDSVTDKACSACVVTSNKIHDEE